MKLFPTFSILTSRLRNRFSTPPEVQKVPLGEELQLTIKKIEKEYLEAGENFAREVSYSYLGRCKGFDELFGLWSTSEEQYAQFGFKTISFDAFLASVRTREPIDKSLLRQKRNDGEFPILHSKIFPKEFLNQSKIDNHSKIENGFSINIRHGSYKLPSTENPRKPLLFNFKIITVKD